MVWLKFTVLVLTWISIYWFSRAGPAASLRIYYEHTKSGGDFVGPRNVNVPIGYSYFPKELVLFPRRCVSIVGFFLLRTDWINQPSWLKTRQLVFESQHERGGHFAAYECPDALVGDLRKMFGKGGPAFGVVVAHTGFES